MEDGVLLALLDYKVYSALQFKSSVTTSSAQAQQRENRQLLSAHGRATSIHSTTSTESQQQQQQQQPDPTRQTI